MLLKKSKTEKVKLIKKIDDILSFKNFPTKTVGKEKNKDKNKRNYTQRVIQFYHDINS